MKDTKASARKRGIARKGNIPKWASYQLAWKRIRQAIEEQFPLEAITIEESIISDRLNSCRSGHGEKVCARDGLKRILECVKGYSDLRDAKFCALLMQVESWYADRCRFLHGIVRTDLHDYENDFKATVPKITAEVFFEKAMHCAKLGDKYARAVCAWSRKEIWKATKRHN